MIIKKADIEGFGKFTNRTFEFSPGFNLIFGKNEDGKTTFMTFLKMLFYSSSGKTEKGQDTLKIPRKKYRSWNGAPMSGAVEFEACGLEYRLHKEFLKSEATDKTTIICKSTGEDENILNPNEAGEHFLGMSLGEFERSVFIGSYGGFSSDASADSLAMRISNLSVSGDESISHELIAKRLDDALCELVSKNKKRGYLVEAEAEVEALKLEKQRILQQLDLQKDLFEEIAGLEAEILKNEGILKRIEHHQNTEIAKKDLNAFYTLSNKTNLRENIQKRLAEYGRTAAELDAHIAKAGELELEISQTVAALENLSSSTEATKISDEEYKNAEALNNSISGLRADLILLRGKVTDAKSAFDDAYKRSVKQSKIVSAAISAVLAALSGIWVCSGIFAKLPLLFAAGVASLCIGIVLFFILSKVLKSKAADKPIVQFAKRDFNTALRELTNYNEDMPYKALQVIEAILNSQLADSISVLDDILTKHNCSDFEELKHKTSTSKAGEIAAITARLGTQKENFALFMAELKPVNSFIGAKIMFEEISEDFKTLESIEADINMLSAATGITDTSEQNISKKIKELAGFLQNSPEQEVTDTDKGSVESELRVLRSRLGECQSRIKLPEKSEGECDRLIADAGARRDAYRKRFDELTIASEVMAEAVSETNKGFGSYLSEKTGEYLSKLTAGRYRDVLVSRSLDVETRTGKGEAFHEWKYLSSGAIDKVYLALRLAATDILTEDCAPLPLFLDDIFAQYDDESCRNALEFLKSYIEEKGGSSQILFFTCHGHIAELAKSIFGDVREISL
ncbi:MAG: hypothetical protein E7401_04795 [Ruminococcaceae bacterium]|nr:hypothetical protein [Oscillospiraceae bacterium]